MGFVSLQLVVGKLKKTLGKDNLNVFIKKFDDVMLGNDYIFEKLNFIYIYRTFDIAPTVMQ